MGVVSDGKKAYRLLWKALASRTSVQHVRRMLAAQGPHPRDHYRIAVYFADGAVNMYQMRQWYKPLAGLAERWPVVVLSRSATGAEKLIEEDGLPVAYVMADEAGALDSPLYGMFSIVGKLHDTKVAGQSLAQTFIEQPADTSGYAIKWDGEWQITYETFRDMGIAYAAGMVLIYLLVVAQFRSYLVPLVIMAPIPLTVIGVMPGHALLGAQFTATSMIGMIALAGIIVRNSILLVDFIRLQVAQGVPLKAAVVRSAATRAQPILLTGLAAMLGAFFILDDPIFNGLAISLIFGILVSTLLTLVVIPLLYFVAYRREAGAGNPPSPLQGEHA